MDFYIHDIFFTPIYYWCDFLIKYYLKKRDIDFMSCSKLIHQGVVYSHVKCSYKTHPNTRHLTIRNKNVFCTSELNIG